VEYEIFHLIFTPNNRRCGIRHIGHAQERLPTRESWAIYPKGSTQGPTSGSGWGRTVECHTLLSRPREVRRRSASKSSTGVAPPLRGCAAEAAAYCSEKCPPPAESETDSWSAPECGRKQYSRVSLVAAIDRQPSWRRCQVGCLRITLIRFVISWSSYCLVEQKPARVRFLAWCAEASCWF